MDNKDYSALAPRIVSAARNELYMSMPYLDAALCSLRYAPGEGVTVSAATDGDILYCSAAYLADRYLRSSAYINRLYLHVLLHCMLRHHVKKQGHDSELWDLACDAAVESIIDSLPYSCIKTGDSPIRQKFYGECLCEMKVLTAEGIYKKLRRDRRSEYERAYLSRAFLHDDHGLWDRDKNDEEKQNSQDEKWKSISEKTETGMSTVFSNDASGGETIAEQLKVGIRDDVDYRAFLRRFAAPHEIIQVDADSFDYIYYTYGLSIYGNMPLIEPPETREEKRIEDLVIAIDTSMSTNGDLVREFLRCTYAILRSTETFTRRLNIRIIQCDNQIRSDTRITSMDELRDYMQNVKLTGGSATDFRPVFEHIEKLKDEGAFTSLRGLIYFTDGMGIYPAKRPAYEAAFVFLEEPPLSVKVPAWCIKLVLGENGLDNAAASIEDKLADEPTEMPEL